MSPTQRTHDSLRRRAGHHEDGELLRTWNAQLSGSVDCLQRRIECTIIEHDLGSCAASTTDEDRIAPHFCERLQKYVTAVLAANAGRLIGHCRLHAENSPRHGVILCACRNRLNSEPTPESRVCLSAPRYAIPRYTVRHDARDPASV